MGAYGEETNIGTAVNGFQRKIMYSMSLAYLKSIWEHMDRKEDASENRTFCRFLVWSPAYLSR